MASSEVPDGASIWQETDVMIGQILPQDTPEAKWRQLVGSLSARRLGFAVSARLDNRDELHAELGLGLGGRDGASDIELALRAYLKWGEACPLRLIGDWSLAAWHSDQRRLFLARDHHGNTSLCFHCDPATRTFAFASFPSTLHAMGVPRRLNELLLAQELISWSANSGLATIDLDIQRLPPAYALSVTPEGMRVWRYWQPEETPELCLPRFDNYVEGFLDIFDQAVRARCRGSKPVGVTLSGGLDSGSVAVLAGRALAERGERLTAFTQVPIADTSKMVGPQRFGDETCYAQATAASIGNVDHRLLTAESVTPLQGIERILALLGRPTHAASNAFWICDLLATAQTRGISVLLTGQGGNATISWTGAPDLCSPLAAFLHAGWKAGLRRLLPDGALHALVRWRNHDPDWSHTAIHPDFAQRLDLAGRQAQAIRKDFSMPQGWRSPRDKRCAILGPGSSEIGETWAAWGAAYGLEVRDPTLDPRVIEYTLAVPDRFFHQQDGLDRQLIRQAMAGLLPDDVRLNPLRGRQSADLAFRLRASATEVDLALEEVAAGPAVDYLNLEVMRAAWWAARDHPDPVSTHRAGSILLRGLMVGLWLNRRMTYPSNIQ